MLKCAKASENLHKRSTIIQYHGNPVSGIEESGESLFLVNLEFVCSGIRLICGG